MSNGFDPTRAIDSSPYGNDGVLTTFADPAAAWIEDSFDGEGYSLEFLGTQQNNIVVVENVDESPTQISVEFAFRTTHAPSTDMVLVGRLDNGSIDRGWAMHVSSHPRMYWRLWDEAGERAKEWYLFASSITSGSWNRVGFSFDNGDYQVYYNGLNRNSEVIRLNDHPLAAIPMGTQPIWWGWYANTSWGTVYTGQLDDIRIYNGILSASDFAALYANAGEPALPLAGHWKLNDPMPQAERAIFLPLAANRDPYEHLTIRNTSSTEDLEVFCQPGDEIDNELASDHVPPREAITYQAAETNIWARVSNFTDPPPCQVERYTASEDLVVTTTPQIVPGTTKLIYRDEIGVDLYDFQSRITVTGIPGNQAWDITLGLYNVTDGTYIREFHVAGAGNPESDVYHNSAAGIALHASMVGKQVALGASRATTAGTVTVLADGTAHALTGPIK